MNTNDKKEEAKPEEQAANVPVASDGMFAEVDSIGNKVYRPSIKEWRREHSKRLNENRRAYEGIANKESSYARAIKQLGDLHEAALKIYKNAPNLI